MAGKDRLIDPVTKDYIKASGGSYKTTRTIGTQVYHQLAGKRGHWWGDHTAGSDLHEVKHHGTGADGIAFAENAGKTALARFVRDGLARDLRVEAAANNNRIKVDASIVDIQGAEVAVTGVTPFEG